MGYIDRTDLFQKYQNKWIALADGDKVVGAGDTLEQALKEASKKGYNDPVTARIPDLKYAYMFS